MPSSLPRGSELPPATRSAAFSSSRDRHTSRVATAARLPLPVVGAAEREDPLADFRNSTPEFSRLDRFAGGGVNRVRRRSVPLAPVIVVLILLLILAGRGSAAPVLPYAQFPTVEGDAIVFAAEGDLWRVSAAGGMASRLTTGDGQEAYARFSPDGQWLAFSAQYDGNVDVYVMPATGGTPRRLTFHPRQDEVAGWRPDSKSIVFRSRRASPNYERYLYEVPLEGGHPVLIDIGTAALVDFDPVNTSRIAFNRFSTELWTWKKYRGGTAQDVWVGDLNSGEFDRITTWEGNDRFPMWFNNRIYFVSDRDGSMNIYSMNPRGVDVRQHTRHTDFDVRWPDMSSDGRIVYMHAGGLRMYEIAGDVDRGLEIALPSDRIERRPRFADASLTVDSYDLSPDGSWVGIASRGEIWRVPTEEGRRIDITRGTPGVRERSISVGPKGDWIACISDETGEQEIALFDAEGRQTHRLLTEAGRGWIFDPVWSPDGARLAYADFQKSLYVVEVESGAVQVVDRAEGWEITEYSFSPDGRWLAYSRPYEPWGSRNSIWLYDVERNARYQVTNDFSHDLSPAWDPNGRYLYFLSSRRFNPLLDERDFQHIVVQTMVPCAVILAEDGMSPFLPAEVLDPDADLENYWSSNGASGDDEDDAEADDEDDDRSGRRDDEDDDDAEESEGDADESLPTVQVDLKGIERRVVEFPVEPGTYAELRATPNRVFYLSSEPQGMLDEVWGAEDARARFALHVFDMVEREEAVAIDALRDYLISGDHATMAWRDGDAILVADLESVAASGGSPEAEHEIDPAGLRLRIDPAAEWRQIFDEAWRLQRDFYWSEDMAGLDWRAMYEKYLALLPRIGTRHELNDLIGEMIGELGTSHTYVWGGDTEDAEGIGVGLIGADVVPDADADALRFAHVLRAETWETDLVAPLTMSHANVSEGDYLFAINGLPVSADTNLYEALAGLEGEEILLTVGDTPDVQDAREVQIRTLSVDEEIALRYADWVRRNREEVTIQTSGRVGYMHLPDMDTAGLIEFIKAFYPQTDRDALIIDVRHNGGGFVSQMIIERLSREVWAWSRSRHGRLETYPSKVHIGPKVVIVNQNSGSDGDIFPESFKLRGLGPIVGTRTWGGVVGIRADKPFIDDGLTTQPEFAFWESTRGWGLENRGVEPDIVVDIEPEDARAGRDPQLRVAIETALRMLQENPPMREPDWTVDPENRPRMPRTEDR